jgi:hypothetical protein
LDLPVAVVVDSADRPVVVGDTGSSNFPTTKGAYDITYNGGDANFPADAFVTRMKSDGSGLIYSTFVGGSLGDGARDVVLDAAARATFVGTSQSTGYPTTSGAYQTTHGGSGVAPFDAVITRLDLLPTGVNEYGFPTNACNGDIAIGINMIPAGGDASVAIDCIGAPPNASGLLILGVASNPTGTPVAGVTVFVDLTQTYVTQSVTSDALGFASQSGIVTSLSSGTTFYAQYYWFNPSGCGPGARSGSNALSVTVY